MTIKQAFRQARNQAWAEGAKVCFTFNNELEVIWAADANQARVIRRGLIADRVADLLDLRPSLRQHLIRTAERGTIQSAQAALDYILN